MMTSSAQRDAGARRIVLFLVGVAAILAGFYGLLAYQAYIWHPEVYARNTDSPASRTLLDAGAPFTPPAPTPKDLVARGRDLYQRMGCAVCHGVEGKGGVTSPNYQRGTFLQLNNISERLFLRDAESHQAALEALKAGTGLEAAEELDVEMPRVVAAQYANVIRIMANGNPALKKDKNGVDPIPMPGWKGKLTAADMRDIVAYLVSLQDVRRYEEEEGEEEEEEPAIKKGGSRR